MNEEQKNVVNEEINMQPSENKKGNKLIPIIIILIGLVLIFTSLFFFTDIFKSNEKGNNEKNIKEKQDESLISKYEGIYTAEKDNMYIHKKSDNEFYYTIGGNFQGVAKIEGDSAKEKDSVNDNYFEFKIVDDGIEVTYHADEDTEVAVDTGLYKKVADYSKENVYKYAVGDPSYLKTRYNGIFKNGNIELYIYQISENEIMVQTNDNPDGVYLYKTFEKTKDKITGDEYFAAKSFFDEDKIAFSLVFYDRSVELFVHDDVSDYDENDKKLELNYKFEKEITQEEIINKFYSFY
jgi:hypothetical protein